MGSKHSGSVTGAPQHKSEAEQTRIHAKLRCGAPASNAAAPVAAEMRVKDTPSTLSPSTGHVSMAVTGEQSSNAAAPQQQHLHRKTFTMAEVQQLISANPNRTLVVIRDKVYDVTTFLSAHPGGKSVLQRNNGKNVTDAFFSLHSAAAVRKLPDFLLGDLVTPKHTSADAGGTSTSALAPAPLRAEDIAKALGEDPRRIILILFGDAYDVTPMRDKHPGGLQVLMNNNGCECGETFMRIHGLRAKKMVQEFYLGPVMGAAKGLSPLRQAAMAQAEAVTPQPGEPKPQSARILAVEPANATATIQYFTFSCCNPLDMIPGGHIKLYSSLNKEESRFYTPFKTEATSFTICMKRYPHGRTSGYFFDRKAGDEVFFDGPLLPAWQLNADPALQSAAQGERHVLLVAGGTGIAPMYSISTNALETQWSSVTLVCSVHTPEDLILATELRQLAARYSKAMPTQKHTFRVVLLFSRSLPQDVSVEFTSFAASVLYGGRLTVESFKSVEIPPARAAVLCGPPAFNDAVAAAVVEAGICTAAQVHCL
ncbi:hypothetical protein LSCM1_03682 [Leishmania martiniquensis]|uniref:Nitrate reductase n=1 Tax=Leishmania martiniquensis TaxID=1580590 RepID=A0A836KNH9_9TRYP|nr:hypothetical protein LSCM1_03682 [Leishmania martiniquensis]